MNFDQAIEQAQAGAKIQRPNGRYSLIWNASKKRLEQVWPDGHNGGKHHPTYFEKQATDWACVGGTVRALA